MNGLIIQWGQSSDGVIADNVERTITFPTGFTYTEKPIVNIRPTEISDYSTNTLRVSYGNSYYGALVSILKTGFTYRGYKISWIAIGY